MRVLPLARGLMSEWKPGVSDDSCCALPVVDSRSLSGPSAPVLLRGEVWADGPRLVEVAPLFGESAGDGGATGSGAIVGRTRFASCEYIETVVIGFDVTDTTEEDEMGRGETTEGGTPTGAPSGISVACEMTVATTTAGGREES